MDQYSRPRDSPIVLFHGRRIFFLLVPNRLPCPSSVSGWECPPDTLLDKIEARAEQLRLIRIQEESLGDQVRSVLRSNDRNDRNEVVDLPRPILLATVPPTSVAYTAPTVRPMFSSETPNVRPRTT
jgi:hypothetical protein